MAEGEALRAAVVAAARGWIGTPYVHGQSLRGAGTDCLGLLRGVWREVFGAEPEPAPRYAAGLGRAGEETLLDAAVRHLVRIPTGAARDGSVILFRWRPHLPARHCAILAPGGRMIHAHAGRSVHETPIPDAWAAKIAAAFDFPGA